MPGKQVNMNLFGNHLRRVIATAPRAIGVLGVNHWKESFRMQRFNDYGSQPWPAATSHKRRNVLIGKQSGALRNSIQTERANIQEIKWVARRPYARIHNEGGITHPKVTPQMRKFAWAMYYKAPKAEKNKWKGLALTKKKTLTIRIPQRKYMGNSRAFNRTINKYLSKQLDYRN